mgnify:CR=1 FL=1
MLPCAGVCLRAENSVGTRTILDVLNAERELLNAQVELVTAQRNSYVAGFQLLAAMGQAEARNLGLDGGPLYLNTEARPWIHGAEHPRTAGVSAFGFGGTNATLAFRAYVG